MLISAEEETLQEINRKNARSEICDSSRCVIILTLKKKADSSS